MLKKDASDVNLLLARGLSHQAMQSYAQAIQDYSLIIANHVSHAQSPATQRQQDLFISSVYTHRALCYRKLEQYDQAVQDYSKLILLSSDHSSMLGERVRAMNHRAFLYAKLTRYREAIEDYSRVIALEPNNSHAYHNRGISYDKLGLIDMAIADFSKVFEIDAKQSHGLMHDYSPSQGSSKSTINNTKAMASNRTQTGGSSLPMSGSPLKMSDLTADSPSSLKQSQATNTGGVSLPTAHSVGSSTMTSKITPNTTSHAAAAAVSAPIIRSASAGSRRPLLQHSSGPATDRAVAASDSRYSPTPIERKPAQVFSTASYLSQSQGPSPSVGNSSQPLTPKLSSEPASNGFERASQLLQSFSAPFGGMKSTLQRPLPGTVASTSSSSLSRGDNIPPPRPPAVSISSAHPPGATGSIFRQPTQFVSSASSLGVSNSSNMEGGMYAPRAPLQQNPPSLNSRTSTTTTTSANSGISGNIGSNSSSSSGRVNLLNASDYLDSIKKSQQSQ